MPGSLCYVVPGASLAPGSWERAMSSSTPGPKFVLHARIKEFAIPPITDGLVIGKEASIGTVALQKALNLLIPDHFAVCSKPYWNTSVGCILLAWIHR